jgi:hypothetical protein
MKTTRRMTLALGATAAVLAASTAAAGAAVIQNAPEIVSAVIVDQHGVESIEPESILLDPSNSVDAVNFIDWWVWNDTTAVGTGVQQVNLCDPTCADGTVINKSVVVELSDPQAEGDDPARFTSATVTDSDGTRTIDLGAIAVMPTV